MPGLDREELVARYLERIGTTSRALADLHRAHLLAVPFENLSIHRGERVHLEVGWLFDKIVTRRRGGFCYELNGLFAELLRALGHEVDLLAARVYGKDGTLGIPFDHVCLRVDGRWLADVGFGDSFITPLRLDTTDLQHDGRRSFRVVDGTLEDEGRAVYVFGPTPHALADFVPACLYHQTSPESHFTRGRVVSRLTPTGRITLRDDRLIVTDETGKHETTHAGDWHEQLARHFGIVGALVIRPMQPGEGATIAAWRYPPPYDFYNDDHQIVDDPALATATHDVYAMLEDGVLVGSCSFGPGARVPGGVYDDDLVDVGLGMRPDLIGRGHGARYLAAALAFATSQLGATGFRATVADINTRALRLCERAGFRRTGHFTNADRGYWMLAMAPTTAAGATSG